MRSRTDFPEAPHWLPPGDAVTLQGIHCEWKQDVYWEGKRGCPSHKRWRKMMCVYLTCLKQQDFERCHCVASIHVWIVKSHQRCHKCVPSVCQFHLNSWNWNVFLILPLLIIEEVQNNAHQVSYPWLETHTHTFHSCFTLPPSCPQGHVLIPGCCADLPCSLFNSLSTLLHKPLTPSLYSILFLCFLFLHLAIHPFQFTLSFLPLSYQESTPSLNYPRTSRVHKWSCSTNTPSHIGLIDICSIVLASWCSYSAPVFLL